ncbi:uncharacterized protein BX663DRAFT_287454 [Cokeromyces recurvatus]|uniref:uncharacterized protein n=1 Tax=Cokeromyces recurvatus TaxID=90255 RepID=UPI00221E71D1|nr:uncharacterized protein BX663DRAFT_287454 [Cokeromyces recurvatus]KAI7905598.1 hypothetical protein BX663DRAFT_287454 [Cokeromyces recurvatus]
MESNNLNWINNDNELMEMLVGIASVSGEQSISTNNEVSPDVLQCLLPIERNDLVLSSTQQQMSSHSSSITPQNNMKEDNSHHVDMSNEATIKPLFPSSVTVQNSDNFVTFVPTTSIPKKNAPIKTVFKKPVFISESPQTFIKKKKTALSSSSSNTSGEDNNSDDDVTFEGVLHINNPPLTNSTPMTSKEKRQLRNKISARNFRVRRKEYVNHLEKKVREYEETIVKLKKENEQLQKNNEELIKKLSTQQPITPPPFSDELMSNTSTTSSSEGHLSPESLSSLFQFQLNDLYDLNLLEQQQQQQQQQQQPLLDPSVMFYLNHATIPDWNINEVLSGKMKNATTEQEQLQISRELIRDYPLLVPALMSIILHHTLSLDYVASLAKEFKEKLNVDPKVSNNEFEDNETVVGEEETNELKVNFSKLSIEDATKVVNKKEGLDHTSFTEDDLVAFILNRCFPYYCLMRARGHSHEDIIDKCRECFLDKDSPCRKKMEKKWAKEKAKKERLEIKKRETVYKTKNNSRLQTLQTYCRVANILLKNPRQMSNMTQVLKEQIQISKNKSMSHAEQNYRKMINTPKALRIANASS